MTEQIKPMSEAEIDNLGYELRNEYAMPLHRVDTILATISERDQEIERLKEFESMYLGLCK